MSSSSGVRGGAPELIEFLGYYRYKMAFPAFLILHLIHLPHITLTCALIYTIYIRVALNFLKYDLSLKIR